MSTGAAATAVRINVRPLADPLPLGLFAFGIGMLMLAGQTAGWIPIGEAKQVGLLLASFVFLLEGFSTVLPRSLATRWPPPCSDCSPPRGWPWACSL